MLLAVFVVLWLALLLLVPLRAITTAAARHAPAPARPVIRFAMLAGGRRQPGMLGFDRLTAGRVEHLRLDGDMLIVKGWAIDAHSKNAADAVRVYYDGILIGSVPTGRPRADVAKSLNHHRADGSGFAFEVVGLPATDSPCNLDLAAEQSDGRLDMLRHSSCGDQAAR